MQPLLWIVTVDKTDPTAGSFTASQQMLVYEIAVKQVTRVVNNRTVTETVQVPVEKTISMSMEFAPESWRLLNAQGKAVPKTEVWSRLKPGKAIFVSATSNVAPSYLKAMASDAVVIVRPETPSAPPAPEADIPAPVQAPTARPNSSPRVPPPAPAPPSAPRPRIR